MIKIYCVGGFTVVGEEQATLQNPFGGLKWIKVKTKAGITIVNSEHIISIVYANTHKGRHTGKGNRTP